MREKAEILTLINLPEGLSYFGLTDDSSFENMGN
jgi:hypothetical protein